MTVSASGMAFGSATSPLSISSASVDPISRYKNGASKVLHRFSRRINVRLSYACTSRGACGFWAQSGEPRFQAASVCGRAAAGAARMIENRSTTIVLDLWIETSFLYRLAVIDLEFPHRFTWQRSPTHSCAMMASLKLHLGMAALVSVFAFDV